MPPSRVVLTPLDSNAGRRKRAGAASPIGGDRGAPVVISDSEEEGKGEGDSRMEVDGSSVADASSHERAEKTGRKDKNPSQIRSVSKPAAPRSQAPPSRPAGPSGKGKGKAVDMGIGESSWTQAIKNAMNGVADPNTDSATLGVQMAGLSVRSMVELSKQHREARKERLEFYKQFLGSDFNK